MTIIADRGLFVRLLVQSGKFGQPDAEALADAMDAASREPATSSEVQSVRADVQSLKGEITAFRTELKSDIALLAQRMDLQEKRTDERFDALQNKLLVRLGGLMLALFGIFFAALRLT